MELKPDQVALAEGQQIIYLATRLFDLSERLSSTKLESAIWRGMIRGFESINVKPLNYPIYMPFRDTNEDQLHDRDDLFWRYIEMT